MTNQHEARGFLANQHEAWSSVANQYEAKSRTLNQHEIQRPVAQDQYSSPRTGQYGHPRQSPAVPPPSLQSNTGQHSQQYSPGSHVSPAGVDYHQTAVNQSSGSYGQTFSRQTSSSSNFSFSPGYHEGQRSGPAQSASSSPRSYGHVSSPQGHSAYSPLASSCDTSVQNSQSYFKNSQPATSSPGYLGNQINPAGQGHLERSSFQSHRQLQHSYGSQYSSHGYQQSPVNGSSFGYQGQGQRSPHNNMHHESYSDYR